MSSTIYKHLIAKLTIYKEVIYSYKNYTTLLFYSNYHRQIL